MSSQPLDFRRNGLIYVDEIRQIGIDPRELRRANARGAVVRIRRGAYCSRETWDSASPGDRHVLAIRAVVRVAHPPFLVAGRSAAALWGMPFAAQWPDDVTLLVPYRGGGASEIGVRRTCAGAAGATAASVDGIPITSLARTALDVARTLSLPRAVAVLDWALWEKNPHAVDRSELGAELHNARYPRGGALLRRALALATELSGSPGESMARVGIHLLGFEAPELQVRFSDAEGAIFPDFYWRGVSIAGEFDGKAKYTRAEYTGGDPGEVAWREKKREDRLRRQVRGVVRILSEHVAQPARLEALLVDAGVPRVRRQTALSAPLPRP
jgi:predicted transcriptional regulator of viral defense system